MSPRDVSKFLADKFGLSMSPVTVVRAIINGDMPATDIGIGKRKRYDCSEADVKRFVESRRVRPAAARSRAAIPAGDIHPRVRMRI